MVTIKQLEIKLQTAKTAKERFEINQAINFIKKQRETAKKEKKLSYGKMERMEVG